MRLFEGLIFFVLGAGLAGIALQSLRTGWLPFGSRGLGRRLEYRRDEQPCGYWLAFVLYFVGGLVLAGFAVRVLMGTAAPLPLQ